MEERGISVPFTENFIAKLQVGEQIIVDQEGKQEAMLQFYEDLLATTENREHHQSRGHWSAAARPLSFR